MSSSSNLGSVALIKISLFFVEISNHEKLQNPFYLVFKFYQIQVI